MADNGVCAQFRNYGSCRREECKLEHSSGEKIIPTAVARFPTLPCKNTENGGTCPRGRFCVFFHSEEDKKRAIPNVCRNYRKDRCIYGDKCPREHMEVQPEERRPLDCIQWVKNGACTPDNLCIYIHDAAKKGAGFPAGEEPVPRARRVGRGGRVRSRGRRGARNGGAASNGAAEKPAGGNSTAQKQTRTRAPAAAAAAAAPAADAGAAGAPRKRAARRTRRPPSEECFKFRDDGNCEKGDQCPFTHGDNDTRDRSQFPRPAAAPAPCRQFKAGNCTRANCRFIHDATSA